MPTLTNSITDISGILVGQIQNEAALTGCTVVLCEKGAVGGVDQRGGAPGTRETDALRPMHLVQHVHAVVLAGGSAFGLDASSGVMRYLEERGVGYPAGPVKVPIVASAILFDLEIGNPRVRPDADMGYRACQAATHQPPAQGCAGAGAGATAGKILGIQQAMKSGIGTACIDTGGGVLVGAIVAANPFGDILNPATGSIYAGTRPLKKGPLKIGGDGPFADTLEVMKSLAGRTILDFASRQNTIIGVVATNARLTKEEANKVAQMAQDGLALAVRPTHTMFDGDTLFCMATGEKNADVNIVGAFAAQAVAQAIFNAAQFAHPAGGLPSANE